MTMPTDPPTEPPSGPPGGMGSNPSGQGPAFCRHCGAASNAGDQFCSSCGAPKTSPPPSPSGPVPGPMGPPPSTLQTAVPPSGIGPPTSTFQPAVPPSGNDGGVQAPQVKKPIYKNRVFLVAAVVVILAIVGFVTLGGSSSAYPASVQAEFLKGLQSGGSDGVTSQQATCILKWFESNVPLAQLEKEGQQNDTSEATSQGVKAALACNVGNSSSIFGGSGLGGLGGLGNSSSSSNAGHTKQHSGNSGNSGNSGSSFGNSGNSGNSGSSGNSWNSGNSGSSFGNSGNSGSSNSSGNSGISGNS
jgi:hypothetical protein